jgi:hypothetical protein
MVISPLNRENSEGLFIFLFGVLMQIPFVWPAQEILRLLDIPSLSNNIPPKSLHIIKDEGLYVMTQSQSETPTNSICYAADCDPAQDCQVFISSLFGESDLFTSIPRETILDLYRELQYEKTDNRQLNEAFFFLVTQEDRIGFGFSLQDPRPFIKFDFIT